MSYQDVEVSDSPISRGNTSNRAAFITKTYNHLLAAVVLFVVAEYYLFSSGYAASILGLFAQTSWLVIMGVWIGVSWLATHFANSSSSKATQYGALGLFIAAEAVIFVPILAIAQVKAPGAIESAATITLIGFGLLTAIAFYTRKDFSFLRSLVVWGIGIGVLAIVGGYFFGYQLGTWFSVIMVGLAGASILYDTSNIIHHYPEDRHVGASLSLFASVAMMFFYILRIFISGDD